MEEGDDAVRVDILAKILNETRNRNCILHHVIHTDDSRLDGMTIDLHSIHATRTVVVGKKNGQCFECEEYFILRVLVTRQ